MRKIKNILLLGVLLIVGFTYNVKAESLKYYLTTKDRNFEYVSKDSVKLNNVKKGDYVYVTAVIDYKDVQKNYKLSSGKLTIRWDDKAMSLQEVNGKYYNDNVSNITGLTIGSVNKEASKLTLSGITSSSSLTEGKNKLVEFKFLVSDNASGETKIYQMDGEDSLNCVATNEEATDPIKCADSEYSEIVLNVSKSTENRLSAIKINGVNLEYFNEDNTNYDVEVDSSVEKVNIEVTKKDSKAKISGNYGENKISYGKNKLVINVISEAETRNTYTINITRTDNRSSINTLKTLTLSSGEINFKPDVTEYNVNVENSVDKITIKSTLTDAKSKYVEDFSNKEITLIEGSNKVQIKVVSEKNEEKVYTININRALSSNNSLKTLMINDEKIPLKENEFTYNFIVENDVDEITIKATPNDEKATIELKDKYPLQEGDNEISINVVAANGEKAAYILNVTRKKLLSKDSLLKNLKIKNYDINFKQDVTLYNLKINDNDNELEIETVTEDENAKVEIEGNKNLENGSIIKINVKAEDGTYTRYFINIEKGSKGISPVIIILIILLLALAAIITVLVIRKKKAKEKEEFKELDKPNEPPKVEEKEEVVETNETSEVNPEENNMEIPQENNEPNEDLENTLETDTIVEKGAHEYRGEHEYSGDEKDME